MARANPSIVRRYLPRGRRAFLSRAWPRCWRWLVTVAPMLAVIVAVGQCGGGTGGASY